MKIYISGAITNNKHYKEDFAKAEEYLREKFPNAEILNPAKTNATLPQSTTWEQYMSICYIMLDMADAIYMIDGWERSKGACIEYGYSVARDKMIIDE